MEVNVESERGPEALGEVDGAWLALGWTAEWGGCCERLEVSGQARMVHIESKDGTQEGAPHVAGGRLARQWEKMMTLQWAVTATVGEMGTIANLEQYVLRNDRDDSKQRFIDIHAVLLAAALGQAWPEDVHPNTRYFGNARLIVLTVRTSIAQGEALNLKVMLLIMTGRKRLLCTRA